jgi:Rifampin ADP-ribosyl transferase
MTKPFEVHESGAFLHGTKAYPSPGELLVPGRRSNYDEARRSNHVYATRPWTLQCGERSWLWVRVGVASTSWNPKGHWKATRT